MLLCSPFSELTDVDIFESFIFVKENSQLDMKNTDCITKKGAPAMLSQKSRFIVILKQETDISYITLLLLCILKIFVFSFLNSVRIQLLNICANAMNHQLVVL